MKKKLMYLSAVLMIAMTASCSSDSEDDLMEPDDGPSGDLVTYTADIRTIINSNCTGCHGSPPTNGAPFSLTTFSDVSSRASGILNAVSKETGESGAMPPAARLSQANINLIDQWIDDGALEN